MAPVHTVPEADAHEDRIAVEADPVKDNHRIPRGDPLRAAIIRHAVRSGLPEHAATAIAHEGLAPSGPLASMNGSPGQSGSPWTEWVDRRIVDHYQESPDLHLPPEWNALLQRWLAVEEAVESHLLALAFHRARHQVSAEHWRIFEAYALQGMTSRTVAGLFGTSHFNVRLIAHRIRKLVCKAHEHARTRALDDGRTLGGAVGSDRNP